MGDVDLSVACAQAGVARAGGRSSWRTRCGCGDKHSFGPGRRAVKRLNEPMAKEPQAPFAWAIAGGLSNLTLRVHKLLSAPGPYREEGADYYRPTDKD